MKYSKACIPLGGAWSSPFVRWQGALAEISSLVYGHPQAPTGARALVELVETLRERGGGIGLFTGCAAGDTAAAIVLRVDG
jgi:hypothetical protein